MKIMSWIYSSNHVFVEDEFVGCPKTIDDNAKNSLECETGKFSKTIRYTLDGNISKLIVIRH